ncbi:RES domain-containing protein [Brenneria izadpanahii]|uniref:RES domain-containing protein n=1 Tax=Brenneria izadpanahii TaxID=2722756 RepID=A0ABX7UMF4_9GAMM|nr:RES domain-containing protein [Brenneria izadpanahii]QTF06733.1 RES domain-containing protein [Brenneria izadpanahii]
MLITPHLIADPGQVLTKVEGIFYRAIDPVYRAHTLSGSRNPGRYSSINQPTLYLSSSPEGVEAAMKSHKGTRSHSLDIVRVDVTADSIFDLRNESAMSLMGIRLEDTTAPWQEIVAKGDIPSSWAVRNRLEAYGAKGLIDPSRKAPGLWHLVLFSWNADSSSQVYVLD